LAEDRDATLQIVIERDPFPANVAFPDSREKFNLPSKIVHSADKNSEISKVWCSSVAVVRQRNLIDRQWIGRGIRCHGLVHVTAIEIIALIAYVGPAFGFGKRIWRAVMIGMLPRYMPLLLLAIAWEAVSWLGSALSRRRPCRRSTRPPASIWPRAAICGPTVWPRSRVLPPRPARAGLRPELVGAAIAPRRQPPAADRAGSRLGGGIAGR
jgi:hypothetical protein